MEPARPLLKRLPLVWLGVAACLLVATAWQPVAAQSDTVTVYRCTDAAGRLTLRDTPCRSGQHQETRAMQRPQDPPPQRQPRAAPPPAQPAPPAPPRLVVVTPPRPLYECVTPDGDRYTSDTDQGDPRWVPLWTIGYPVVIDDRPGGRVGAPPARPPHDRPGVPGRWPPHGAVVYPGVGTWVRDACHPLPQAEVCDRLRATRADVARRYNSALQGERQAINTERRRLDARLANDCGA